MSIQEYIIGDAMKLMKDISNKSVDLIITDPPYNVALNYNTIDDNLSYDDYLAFSKKWFSEAMRIADSVIFTPGFTNLKMWLIDIEYPKGIAILYAPNQTSASNLGGWNHYEPILCYGKLTLGKNVFKHNNTKQTDIGSHPCPKQTPAWEDIISSIRPKPQNILDPFLGSGTTLRAARNLSINALGFEIDPSYEDVIKTRSMCTTPSIKSYF